MSRTVTLRAESSARALYDLLSDPHRRPEWQSSLRRVAQVVGTGEAGTRWYDVTAVGARPRMEVTLADPPRRWAESGRWRGLLAELDLRFDEVAPSRTDLTATFSVHGRGAWAAAAGALELMAGPAITADLRRAVALAR